MSFIKSNYISIFISYANQQIAKIDFDFKERMSVFKSSIISITNLETMADFRWTPKIISAS